MSHYHAEVIVPPWPVPSAEEAVKQVMAPFQEGQSEEDSSGHDFWDWWAIGGRWSGAKMEARLDKEKLDAFRAELSARKVTVFGIQEAGKPSLEPPSQRVMVDALWAEHFPDIGGTCPLFDHYDGKNGELLADICTVKDLPDELTCATLLIASEWPNGQLRCDELLHQRIWNGVSFQKTSFGGRVKDAIVGFNERGGKYMVGDDWLAITVDYHS